SSSYCAGRASIEKLPLTASLTRPFGSCFIDSEPLPVPLDANLPEPFTMFHEPAYVLTPAPCRQSVPDVMRLSESPAEFERISVPPDGAHLPPFDHSAVNDP